MIGLTDTQLQVIMHAARSIPVEKVARCHRYNKLEPMEHVEYLCLPHGTAPIVGNSVDANNYNSTLSVLCAEPRVSLLLLRLQITSFRTKETTICFGMVSCSPCVHSITTRQSNASNAKAATRSMLSTAMHATCTASRSTRGIQAIRSNEGTGGGEKCLVRLGF